MRRETIRTPDGPIMLVYGRCCRWWPLAAGNQIRACGLCHEVPVVDPDAGPEVLGGYR